MCGDLAGFLFNDLLYVCVEYAVDLLYSFANCSGLELIFGLNALLRTPENAWDSQNAELLLNYCERRQYRLSWELGNGMTNCVFGSEALPCNYNIVYNIVDHLCYFSSYSSYRINSSFFFILRLKWQKKSHLRKLVILHENCKMFLCAVFQCLKTC